MKTLKIKILCLLIIISFMNSEALSGVTKEEIGDWNLHTTKDDFTDKIKVKNGVVEYTNLLTGTNHSFMIKSTSNCDYLYHVSIANAKGIRTPEPQKFRVRVDKNEMMLFKVNPEHHALINYIYFTNLNAEKHLINKLTRQLKSGKELLIEFNKDYDPARFSLKGFTKVYNKICK